MSNSPFVSKVQNSGISAFKRFEACASIFCLYNKQVDIFLRFYRDISGLFLFPMPFKSPILIAILGKLFILLFFSFQE